jgi:hypothetical protein
MHRFVHVGLAFPGVPKMHDLEPAFGMVGDWVRYAFNCWACSCELEILSAIGSRRRASQSEAALDRSETFLRNQDPKRTLARIRSRNAAALLRTAIYNLTF